MKTFKEIRETDEQIAKMKARAAAVKKKVKDKFGKIKALPGKLKGLMKNLPGVDMAKKLAEDELEQGKYLKYSDLHRQKARLIVKVGRSSKEVAAVNKEIAKEMKNLGFKEGKMIWNHKPIISDGTMQMGIFDGDKEKAMEAARQLIFFLRKNKKTKIGKKDPEQNDSNADISKYSEELSKLIFDDKLLDDLEPTGNNENQGANDVVIGRLRDLGVRIK